VAGLLSLVVAGALLASGYAKQLSQHAQRLDALGYAVCLTKCAA
jgi:hypothetical protein